MLLACTRRRHSRHAKPYPKVFLEVENTFSDHSKRVNCILGHRLLSFLLLMLLARRKHLFRSFGECELHSGPPKYCLLSFLLLTLLACTRRRHSRHAKPYPKVILERRKHLFGSFGGRELHSGPPIALLPTAHASCLHPQAPQSARQTIPTSNFRALKTRTAFWATDCSPSYCSCFLLAPAGATVGTPNRTQK